MYIIWSLAALVSAVLGMLREQFTKSAVFSI